MKTYINGDKRVYEKKRIVIAHLENIVQYPPVISLIDNLLSNSHRVYLVSYNVTMLPADILENDNFHYTDIPVISGKGLKNKYLRGTKRIKIGRSSVQRYMKDADILWTTTDLTVRCLGKILFEYKHVMQLMELERWYPWFKGTKVLKFPIDGYARQAWKVVVPEVNRAYIQKTWWNLKKTPYVLPNKAYRISSGIPMPEMEVVLQKIQNEKRKVLLYLGSLALDRNLDKFAKAVQELGDCYCLYVVGKVWESGFEKLMEKYPFIEYLGYYPAPNHLLFLPYAHIGLLPYTPTSGHLYRSELNALYCAPNKIFEYSGYGIPMLGTDVPGLRQPFQQYDIGVCCKELSSKAIIESIKEIEQSYEIMSKNCKKFYDSVDLDEIVERILYEEN